MSQEYGADVALPLLLTLALLATATAGILAWGARLAARPEGARPPGPAAALAGVPWRWCVLFVTIVFLAANQLLVRGVAVGRWDAEGQFFPYYVLVADHARAARFVQWDPWSSGGLPALGDPQVGAFSPVHVALGLLTGGSSWGFTIYWLTLWWLGGVGMLMLGRHLGAPRWGACAVAVGFLFCGVYTGNAEHTSWISAFSFLPVTIWRLDVALCSRKLQPAAEAGVAWGLSALGGYPGVVIVTGCFAALWALGRAVLSGSCETTTAADSSSRAGEAGRPSSPGFALAILAVVLMVGILVLSPAYFSFFFEAAGTNPRVGQLSRAVALSNSLEPGAMATFATPYLTALKVVRQFPPPGTSLGPLWPATDASMVSVYLGAIVPSLAVLSLLRRPGSGWRWWVAVLAVLSIACAMGETLPVRGWLYDWVYPTRFFRHSALFRLYYLFALCVLALIATRDLAVDLSDPSTRGRAHFVAATALAAGVATLAAAPFLQPGWTVAMPGKAVLLGAGHFAAVWVGVCAVALLAWALPSHRRRWCVPVLLVGLAAGDAVVTAVLSIPTLLRVGAPAERWKELDQRHRSSLELTAGGLWRGESSCEPDPLSERCRRNDQLITKTPVFDAYTPDKNPFHLAMVHDPVLRDMATGAQRIWFSENVARVPATEGLFAAFQRRAALLGAPPLVVHSPEALLRRDDRKGGQGIGSPAAAALDHLPAARRIPARVLRYVPEELAFDIHPTTGGWLLVTDRWARGWRVEVNGSPARLEVGNFLFRALQVSAGTNRVRFTYHPAGFPWLLLVSWGAVAVVVGRGLRAGPHLPTRRLADQ